MENELNELDDLDDLDLEHSDLWKTLKKIRKYEQKIRTAIISVAISLESEIEQIIAWHFCQDESKHLLFLSLMFNDGQVTLSQKIVILRKLFRESYPDLYQQFSGIFSQLDKIRELRNKLAHSQHTIPELRIGKKIEKPQKGIHLEYYKNGKSVSEFISLQTVEEISHKARVYPELLFYIREEIKSRIQGKRNANLRYAVDSLNRMNPNILPVQKTNKS